MKFKILLPVNDHSELFRQVSDHSVKGNKLPECLLFCNVLAYEYDLPLEVCFNWPIKQSVRK